MCIVLWMALLHSEVLTSPDNQLLRKDLAARQQVWVLYTETYDVSIHMTQMLPGRCSSLPISHLFFTLLKKHTHLYTLFACCNWGIQRLMLWESALNLIDQANACGIAAVEGFPPCTAPISHSCPPPSDRPSCVPSVVVLLGQEHPAHSTYTNVLLYTQCSGPAGSFSWLQRSLFQKDSP